ncbi:MAG TPA: PqiC family protein [Candidatus Binatia bacterium]
MGRPRTIRTVLILILISLAGCPSFSPQPDNTRYFSLTPQMDARADANAAGLDQLFLGVGPVRLPGYLDREELVTRISHNRFDVAQNDRWVEPLEDNFSRVLAQDLYALLKTERIVRYPWPSSRRITHQVEIEVIRFEPVSGEDAQLTAQWTLTESGTKQPLAIKNSSFRRPVKQRSKEAAVDALSELLGDFSREIADAVRAAGGQQKAAK